MRGGAFDYVMKATYASPETVERGLEKAEEQRQRRRIEEELAKRDAILEAVRFAADQSSARRRAGRRASGGPQTPREATEAESRLRL